MDCPACNGNGFIDGSGNWRTDCRSCGGTGKVGGGAGTSSRSDSGSGSGFFKNAIKFILAVSLIWFAIKHREDLNDASAWFRAQLAKALDSI